MKVCLFKKNAFTISEAIIVLVILGIIAGLSIAGVKLYNPVDKGNQTLSWKMAENIESATLSYDDFLRIKDGGGYFSIEDANITKRISDLYTNYLSDVKYGVDLNNDYFSSEILDYDRSSTGETLKNAYSNFFYVTDGMLIGFRFYQSCKSIEKNANPPEHKGRYSMDDVCGSIFFDINAFKKPNKLGSDQYILPFGVRGIEYNKD